MQTVVQWEDEWRAKRYKVKAAVVTVVSVVAIAGVAAVTAPTTTATTTTVTTAAFTTYSTPRNSPSLWTPLCTCMPLRVNILFLLLLHVLGRVLRLGHGFIPAAISS